MACTPAILSHLLSWEKRIAAVGTWCIQGYISEILICRASRWQAKSLTELLIIAKIKKKYEGLLTGIRDPGFDVCRGRTRFVFLCVVVVLFFSSNEVVYFPQHQLDMVLLDLAALFQIWKWKIISVKEVGSDSTLKHNGKPGCCFKGRMQ